MWQFAVRCCREEASRWYRLPCGEAIRAGHLTRGMLRVAYGTDPVLLGTARKDASAHLDTLLGTTL